MRRSIITTAVALGLVAAAAPPAPAKDVGADVVPRITIGGRVISTLEGTWLRGAAPGNDDSTNVSIADSSLLARFDRRLFDQSVGGAVIGLEFPDPDADFTDSVFYHQVFAFLWDQYYQVELGRTKLRNTLVEFPTLRDDDLLTYTEVLNGFSNSNTEEYQQFGNHLAVDLFRPRQYLAGTAYLSQRIETDAGGTIEDSFDVNSGGILVQRTVPDTLKFSSRLRQLGFGWDTQKVDVDGDNWKNAFLAGAVMNLTVDPQDHWEAMVQAIYDTGAGEPDLATVQGQALAESFSVVGAVNYRRSTFQLLRWRAGLTAAYKDYRDADGSVWSVVPTVRYRLGDGVEVVAQYQYTNWSGDLARGDGFDEAHTAQLGLTFDFETMFNDYIGERQSILNLEHGYVR